MIVRAKYFFTLKVRYIKSKQFINYLHLIC